MDQKHSIQYRFSSGLEVRSEESSRMITGMGIVFNSDSVPMEIWDSETGRIIEVYEQINPESLKGTDMRDIISAYNHNFDKVLGRTSSGTMKIHTDQKGVEYRVEVPDTSYGNDVLELVRRGDLKGSSFVFSMDWGKDGGYHIEEREDGNLVAWPKKISKVYEMGPVIRPAYESTTAENRQNTLQTAVTGFIQSRNKDIKREQNAQLEAREAVQEENIGEDIPETNTGYTPLRNRYRNRLKLHKLRG